MTRLLRGENVLKGLVTAATLALVLALALAGCGSSGSSQSNAAPGAIGSAGTSTTPTAGAPTGKSVTVMDSGYIFQVSLARSGVSAETTFTTNDSSGFGGTSIDAPPRKILVAATITVADTTDRQEPLPVVDGSGPLDYYVYPQVMLAVPQSDASAFGVPSQIVLPNGSTAVPIGFGCTTGAAPAGYCSLGAMLVGFSPAQTDPTVPPQLSPGSSGSLTILAGDASIGYSAAPQSAPIQDVKVFIGTTVGGDTNAPGYWAALN